VAVDTEQFPVTAVRRVVVVILILVVNGQFPQPFPAEFPPTPGADMRKQLERLFPVAPFALLPVFDGLGYHTLNIVGIVFFH